MKVKCIHNKGEDLRPYEFKPLRKNELGRFETTSLTIFNGLTIGKEYIVMGMLWGKGSLDYLIDDRGYAFAYPYPLFEIIDNKLSSSWFFKSLKNTDKNYPYREAIWGYYELVFDNDHYEKLMNIDENALQIYFRRKIELEKEYNLPLI